MSADLLVTGTGSLAEAVLFDLATLPAGARPLRIVLAGRNAARLAWLVQATNARAVVHGTPHRVVGHRLDWDAAGALDSLLAALRPALVFNVASLQSMWEIAAGRDAWAATIRAQGYGATLPLQVVLALRVARAIAAHSPGSRFVNACYPDAVNEILVRLGHDVVCGIGNVATLAAAYHAEMDLAPGARLRMLAHHWHVGAAIAGHGRRHAPRVWVDARACEARALPDPRLPADASLNRVTGATGAVLLAALLGRIASYAGHAPGPNGLPGGYPVAIEAGRLSLDLPAGLELEAAVALNREWSAREHVELDASGTVRTGARDGEDDIPGGAPLPCVWSIETVEQVARQMLRTRAELQAVASPPLQQQETQ
ncbi:hypothetical protein ACR42A_33265 [Burkholderia gladioli]|uniref:hypothetical protein n=1 Tax=Burkholderia gladioli TaxID=28095 RepID=UPI001640792A|nr:hypothetical protein [Burkholderia gladioli]MBU9170249.1 hypothetical protein [Burkholderia gladioli]MBU9642754.1 hypothetical protein [Burkholderia gladioli]